MFLSYTQHDSQNPCNPLTLQYAKTSQPCILVVSSVPAEVQQSLHHVEYHTGRQRPGFYSRPLVPVTQRNPRRLDLKTKQLQRFQRLTGLSQPLPEIGGERVSSESEWSVDVKNPSRIATARIDHLGLGALSQVAKLWLRKTWPALALGPDRSIRAAAGRSGIPRSGHRA